MLYSPVYSGVWHDEALDGTPFEEKGFFVFLCSNHRIRPSGIYRVTEAQIAADTELPIKRVADYLTDLHQRGRIVRDGAWLFVRGYFARQPKQDFLLRGVMRDVFECSSRLILESFAEKYPIYKQWSADRLAIIARPSTKSTATEQSRLDAEQSRADEPLPTHAQAGAWPSPAALIALYNAKSPDECPSVVTLSPKRAANAKRVLAAFPDQTWWEEVFAQMRASRFLRGLKNRPGSGHEKWVADFDWLVTSKHGGTENCVLVHDGRYLDG